jgi:hypothetical protein
MTNAYVEKILEKQPTTIYIQTDDYGAYEEACNIVNKISKDIICQIV